MQYSTECQAEVEINIVADINGLLYILHNTQCIHTDIHNSYRNEPNVSKNNSSVCFPFVGDDYFPLISVNETVHTIARTMTRGTEERIKRKSWRIKGESVNV